MSAFSRGCLFRHQSPFTPRTIHLLFPSKSFPSSRTFSISSIWLAKQKIRVIPTSQAIKKAPSKVKPSFKPTKTAHQTSLPTKAQEISRKAVYQSYVTTLAQKSHPTLIYEAPSQTAFLVASYSASAFCFTYAVISYWGNVLYPPEGLAVWIPYAFTGVSFLMVCFGGWLFLGPARLIRTVTAIPRQARAISTAASKATSNSNPELQIEVVLRKMFPVPFFPARKIYVNPGELILARTLLPPPSRRLSPQEEMEWHLMREREAKAAHEYEKNHILTSPFRDASRAFYSLFKAIGRTWTREGFLKLEVKGSMYKLDIQGGWALDRGRALDRLSTIKPEA